MVLERHSFLWKDASYVSHGLFGYAEEFEPLAERTYGVGQSRDLPTRSSNAHPAGAGHLAESSGHGVQSPRENRRHEEDRPGRLRLDVKHTSHYTLHEVQEEHQVGPFLTFAHGLG